MLWLLVREGGGEAGWVRGFLQFPHWSGEWSGPDCGFHGGRTFQRIWVRPLRGYRLQRGEKGGQGLAAPLAVVSFFPGNPE